jgi:integrase
MTRVAVPKSIGGVSIAPRGESWRLRWRTPEGVQQSTTVRNPSDVMSCARKIVERGYAIAGNDPDVRSGALWRGGIDLPAVVVPMTFEEVAEEVLAARVRTGLTSERTANGHRSRIRRMPWRASNVAEVTSDTVNEWLTTERRADRLAGRTSNQYRMTVGMVLHAAVRRGARVAVDNLAGELVKAREPDRDDWLSAGQVADIVDACAEPLFADLVQVLAYMGFRINEALGLLVSDVDLRRQTISVRGSLVGAKSAQGWSEGKTKNTPRTIEIMDDDTLAAIVRRIDGRRGDVPLFVWPEGAPAHSKIGTRVGTTPCGEVCRRRFRAALVAVGLKPSLRLHDLRHTHVTWLLNDGATYTFVAKRIGDTVGEVATTYAHIDPHGEAVAKASLRGRAAAARSDRRRLQVVA